MADIMQVVEMMEDAIEKSFTVPLTGKILVNKDEMLDLINEIRLQYPEELEEAKWIQGERKKILTNAEERADALIKSAEAKMNQLVDENEILRIAQEKADQVRDEAEENYNRMKTDSDQYAEDVLGDVERRLEMLLNKVREDRNYFENKQ